MVVWNQQFEKVVSQQHPATVPVILVSMPLHTGTTPPNGWPHRPFLDVQAGSSLAALLADGPSAGGRRSCMGRLYGTPLLAPPDKNIWTKSKWATKLEALSESDSVSDPCDNLEIAFYNEPTTFFPTSKVSWILTEVSNSHSWIGKGSKVMKGFHQFHPATYFPTKNSAWWKTSRGPFCDSNFQLLPPLVRTTKERRALGTNLGIILKQHGSTECDACYRNLPPHIFWLIPPLEEFQMFSCS